MNILKRSCTKNYPEKDLNEEEQVACLLDMSQDKALLAITYGGMQPWI